MVELTLRYPRCPLIQPWKGRGNLAVQNLDNAEDCVDTQSERGAATSQAMHALGRLGEPAQVASLITWLLDPANSWITGEVFSIDGGLANVRANSRQAAS